MFAVIGMEIMFLVELKKIKDMKLRKEVKIGIFTVVILGLLYWGVNFLKGSDLFNSSNTYYAYYDSAGGIQNSSPIIILGITAGQVTGVKLRPDLNNQVEVRFDVKTKYDIPDNSVAKMFSNGLMGGKAIEVQLGNSKTNLPDGATMKSQNETSLLEMAGSEIDVLKQHLYDIMSSLELTLNNVNGILGDNRAAIAGTFNGIERGAQALGSRSEELKQIIDNINTLSATLAGDKVVKVVDNLESVSNSLAAADLGATVTKLNTTINEINTLLASVNASDGTVGMLVNDKVLYESLTQATENLATLLNDIKSNPKKYVHFSLF